MDPDNLKARHKIEEDFHDKKARWVKEDLYSFGALESADEFCWLTMGDLRGKRILDLGCGDGYTSIRFARGGADVAAIDISPEMINISKINADRENVGGKIRFMQMSGEELDFPDESFDMAYGHSILHHLSLDRVFLRLARILGPGGFALFLEPLGHNPLIRLYRAMTPGLRTPTEQPLDFEVFKEMEKRFSAVEHREFYFLSLLSFFWYYGIRNKRLFHFTERLVSPVDSGLFRLAPFTRKYAWVSVIKLFR